MARPVLMTFACAVALTAAALTGPAAVSAPADHRPRAAGPGGPSGPPQRDADGDRVSDDLEPRLRAAAALDRLAVIVTGVGVAGARRAVGPFAVTHRLPIIDGFSADLSAGQVRALSRHPAVERISADGVVRALDDAGNRDFGASGARADAPGLDGSGVGVCVVDTGVDPAHEQLSGRVAGFFDAVNGRTTAYDDHGHGTHVAGIAVGDGTGAGAAAQAGAGVAPAATLYAAKVLDGSGYGSDSQVIAGVQWCAVDRAAEVDVISMSLGDDVPSDGTDPLSQAVDAAVAGGDVVVVAAGNSGDAPGTISSPGVARQVVTVGAASDWSAPAGTARHDDGIWLAGFSSRGPTIDERTKPDVVAPGVSVTAAQAGTTSGYVTYSGTSMATPYVAGAVALALEADPATTPADVKAALRQTAAERGPVGVDADWGAGLVDVRAFVDAVAPPGSAPDLTSPVSTPFPTWGAASGTVPDNGSVDVPVTVPADGGGKPLAVTLTITGGEAVCSWFCLIQEWSPDLDVRLLNSAGQVVAASDCALDGLTCGIGRQETVGVPSVQAGASYTLRVFAFTDSPNDGRGGQFRVDVSNGVVGSAPPPPPPPPPPPADPQDPVAVATASPDPCPASGGRKARCTFTLSGVESWDPDGGGVVSYSWKLGRKVVGASATLTQTKGVGSYTYVLTVTDDEGATDTASVTVDVVG